MRRGKEFKKAIQPALEDLNLIRVKRLRGDPLSAEEHAAIDYLIDEVTAGRDPRERYWIAARESVEPMKKLQMAMRVASKLQASPGKRMEDLWSEVAIECDSTDDVVAKAWAAYQKM